MTSVPQASLATTNTEIRSRYTSGLLNPKVSKVLGVPVSYPVRLSKVQERFFYVSQSSTNVGLARNKRSKKENDVEVVLATILAPLQELNKAEKEEILKQKRFVYLDKENKNIFKFHACLSQELSATVVIKSNNEYSHSKKEMRFETINEDEENDLLGSYKSSDLNE